MRRKNKKPPGKKEAVPKILEAKKIGTEIAKFRGRRCSINWDDTVGNLVKITILDCEETISYYVSKYAYLLKAKPISPEVKRMIDAMSLN